jgi:hypothetical protein
LQKNPADYAVNNSNKKIGLLLGAKPGDIICYYETDKGISINYQEIDICKYKEMLMAAVNDALGILGYDSTDKMESEIFGIIHEPKRKYQEKDSIGKITKD